MPIRTLAEREQNWHQFLRERGLKIRQERRKKGLSRERLAELIGSSAGSVGNWERGDCDISRSSLTMLCDVLGISVEYLQGEDDIQEVEAEVATDSDDPTQPLDGENILDVIAQLKQKIAAFHHTSPSRVRVMIEVE